ncbi:MAG: nucleotidyltransferase family protein [Leptolinea sp.]|nr:nucleotidyltransferase family protein [Leptolinea sp.]
MMDTNVSSYIEKIIEIKPVLMSKFHVSHLSIFGSYARGNEKKSSDLDILISFSKIPSLFQFIGLKDYLTDSLGIEVDLVIREDLKPMLSGSILKEKVDVV